jgi:hypothetical protein
MQNPLTTKMDTKPSLKLAREYVSALKKVQRLGAELAKRGRYATETFLKEVENEECYVADLYRTYDHKK